MDLFISIVFWIFILVQFCGGWNFTRLIYVPAYPHVLSQPTAVPERGIAPPCSLTTKVYSLLYD